MVSQATWDSSGSQGPVGSGSGPDSSRRLSQGGLGEDSHTQETRAFRLRGKRWDPVIHQECGLGRRLTRASEYYFLDVCCTFNSIFN